MNEFARKTTADAPKVSIITPTFNRRHLLHRSWRSLQSQSFHNFEWVVIDDGSTDDTASLVESFDDPRIRYIFQENRGVNSARNRGEQEARGAYVVFLDSDDELASDHALERMIAELTNAPSDVIAVYFGAAEACSGRKMYQLQMGRFLAHYEDHVCEQTIEGEFFPIFRREALRETKWPEDVSGLECLRHWELARQGRTLFIDEIARCYHTASGDNLSGAASAIRRSNSMISATKLLIERHQSVWKSRRPSQLGRYSLFLAMYQALAGQKGALGNALLAFRFGTNAIRRKAILLLATLCLPLSWRHQLFIWRSTNGTH